MKILDSNVWIAFFDTNDSQHIEACNIFENTDNTVLIHEYILLEVYTVLKRKRGADHACTFLDMIPLNQDVQLLFSSQDFCQQVIHLAGDDKESSLSFADIALLLLSEEHEVITFDQDLQKALRQR